jgi:transcriptional regulator with XRE-family HTH domain
MSTSFGARLRWWRKRRGLSQLDLAGAAGVSQRHVSFLESGRTQPSREMVLCLAAALDVPLRQQNALLVAAGFAPIWGARDLMALTWHQSTRRSTMFWPSKSRFPRSWLTGTGICCGLTQEHSG